MDITDFYVKYKKAIILIGVNVLGLLILLGAVKLLTRAATGPVPNPETASPKDLVQYMADPAVQMLPSSERLDLYKRTWENMNEEKLVQFNQAISNLSDNQAQQLKDNAFEVAKDAIVQDCQEYYNLSKSQKREFIDGKLKQMSAVRSMFTDRSNPIGGQAAGINPIGGKNGGRGVKMSANPKLNQNMPATPAGVYKVFLDRTNPSDRAKMETYVNDVQNRITQLKAIQKSQGK